MNMEQKAHTLKKMTRKDFPGHFIFLDTETTQVDDGQGVKKHYLKIGIAQWHKRQEDQTLYKQAEKVFTTQDEFMNWLMTCVRARQGVYLVAHNIVYDAAILDLFRLLPKRGFRLESLYSKGQVCIIRWKRNKTTLTMLDNGNIFAGSLARWGRIFDFPKLEINFETCTREELETYCRRDVEIMVRAWSEWLAFAKQNDTVGFRETVASTAFGTWRYKFMPVDPYVHKDQAVLSLEREAYHGGRVEVFQQGLMRFDTYYYLDINNMYGYVMKYGEYPYGLQGYTDKITTRRLVEYLRRYSVIARVNLTTDEPVFLHKVNGRAAYPVGTFEEVLTTNELIYAFEHGFVNQVLAAAWYKKAALFTDYVQTFYDLRMQYRQAHNAGFEQICKLLVNGLYGKFGQTGMKQKVIGKASPQEVWTETLIHADTGRHGQRVAIGGVVYDQIAEGESYHSMPGIAAHITANARLHLWSLIQQAGRENVYYCDTDSLIVNSFGYYNLEQSLDENKLGMLKIELSSPWVEIRAPKDYSMQGRNRIKGIRDNAEQLDSHTFRQEQWVKMAGLIRQGFQQGYTSKEIIKHQAREITSGLVDGTGRVTPFEL